MCSLGPSFWHDVTADRLPPAPPEINRHDPDKVGQRYGSRLSDGT